ncbi:MAG: hypothetical protein MUF23_03440 [Pirellula sp.]|nr:hypothetical protein [Pirellula sp.]
MTRILIALLFAVLGTMPQHTLYAQTATDEVWEYSPYRVRVWVSISPTLGLDESSKELLYRRIAENCEIEFGATANIEVGETPDALFGSVLYHLDELTVEQLVSRELVLMLSKSDTAKDRFLEMQPKKEVTVLSDEEKKKLSRQQLEELKAKEDAEMRAASLNSVRTLDSVMDRLPKIAVQSLQFGALQRDMLPFFTDRDIPNLQEQLRPLLARQATLESQIKEFRTKGVSSTGDSEDSKRLQQVLGEQARLSREIQTVQPLLERKERDIKNWKILKDKAENFAGSADQLRQDLEQGTYFAALVPKSEAAKFKDVARSIPTRFPWQPEALLRDKDKIVLVSLDRDGETISLRLKELDAFVRRIGLLETMQVRNIDEIPQATAYLQRRSFTPMARIEDNDNKTAVLRVRAVGLATDEDSPVYIRSGDVVAPFIRRDDLNGNPTVLQSLPFTYIAVTEPIDAARFYGAIFAASRGSLVAAKNRRTKRVALKIQPRFASSQLKLGIRQMPGSAVPGAEVYLRTPGTEDLSMVGRTDWRGVIDLTNTSPPTITYELPTASNVPSIARARMTVSADGTPAAENELAPPAEPTEEEKLKRRREKPPTNTIAINVPLYLYYIKNGETLLARLPIITGFRELEKADLPDDRRRLQAEAFLKGLQGEVLDVVVRRKILESRIQRKLDEGKLDDAATLLDELKKVKNYEGMSAQIQAIQRRAFATESGNIPGPVAERIDKMIDTTRVLMQQYLQSDLVRELEVKLIEKQKQ